MKRLVSGMIAVSGFALCLSPSCVRPARQPDALAETLDRAAAEFKITDFSYLVAGGENILARRFPSRHDLREMPAVQVIMDEFTAPAMLNCLIRDSIVRTESIKDLLLTPANTSFSLVPEQRTALILQVINGIKDRHEYNGLYRRLRRSLGIFRSPEDIRTLLHDLLKTSIFFDRNNPEYLPPGPSIPDLYPTWYSRNLSQFFGWNVLILRQQTILWNFFSIGEDNVLVMKWMNGRRFIACSYRAAGLPTPFNYNKKDLLQSPLAIALIRTMIGPDPILEKKDLVAHARYCRQTGDSAAAARLYGLYRRQTRDSLLPEYLDKPVLAATGYICDKADIIVPFELKDDSKVRIFAGGQLKLAKPHQYYAYQYDNISLFMNPGRPDNPSIVPGDTRIFRFNYRSDHISGSHNDMIPDSWISNTGIRFAFSDPDDTTYLLEIKIPWAEILAAGRREAPAYMGLNFFISDGDLDEDAREGILSWSAAAGDAWDDPHKFGLLSLGRKPSGNEPQRISAVYTGRAPVIDGLPDQVWNSVSYTPIGHCWLGTIVSPLDCSGRFKALYDRNYLYFLIHVTDNCKNRAGIVTTDKCWIEDTRDGQVIWKMTADTTQPAWFPSFREDRAIGLRAGKYRLRYRSDERHSFENWYGPSPEDDQYGAQLYENIEPSDIYPYPAARTRL